MTIVTTFNRLLKYIKVLLKKQVKVIVNGLIHRPVIMPLSVLDIYIR